MLEEVDNPNFNGMSSDHPEKVWKAFTAVSGAISPMKSQLANSMLVDWMLALRKEKFSPSECEYFQPSTTNLMLRTFFPFMARFHNWKYTTASFSNFEGCLSGVLKAIYEQRRKEYVS
jgi:hypothetical protein